MRSRDEALSRLSMRNPWHLLATGFGSGLSPVVPGTMGSLAAIPFWYLMTFLPWQLYSLVVMMSICIGVYLCHRTAKDMGTHDHGSIVWDDGTRVVSSVNYVHQKDAHFHQAVADTLGLPVWRRAGTAWS